MLSTLSESCCDLQSWIEEAMVEIAIENEVNEECKELSLAMEVGIPSYVATLIVVAQNV